MINQGAATTRNQGQPHASSVRGSGAATTRNQGQTQHLLWGVRVLQLPETRGKLSIYCEGFGCCNYQKPRANSASTARGPGAATTRNQGQPQHLLWGVRVLQLPETRGKLSIYCEGFGCCNYQKPGANSASPGINVAFCGLYVTVLLGNITLILRIFLH